MGKSKEDRTIAGVYYLTSIEVSYSSLAEQPTCRVRVKGDAWLDEPPRPFPDLPHGLAPGSIAVLLTRKKAKHLRDELDDFIRKSNEDRQVPGVDTSTSVEVSWSSLAEQPACWVNVKGDARLDAPPRPFPQSQYGEPPCAHGLAPGSISVLLTRKQAEQLRDALDAWLKEAKDVLLHYR